MREVACGIMRNKEGKILMGLRHCGYWEFPGGKLERGESIQNCLKREWLEELNLKIEIDKEIYDCKYGRYFCRFFTGKIIDEENISVNVHKKIEFLHIDAIRKLKLFESDYHILDILQRQQQS